MDVCSLDALSALRKYFVKVPAPALVTFSVSLYPGAAPSSRTESGYRNEGVTPSFLAELHNLFPYLSEGILPWKPWAWTEGL